MRPFPLATLAAALLGLHSIIRLPYPLAFCWFMLLAALAWSGFRSTSKPLTLRGFAAFLGFLALSAIMGGYYADEKGVGGTVLPELVVGGAGSLLLIFEIWRGPARR